MYAAWSAADRNARSNKMNQFEVNKFVYEVNLTTVLFLVQQKTVCVVLLETELPDLSELIFQWRAIIKRIPPEVFTLC